MFRSTPVAGRTEETRGSLILARANVDVGPIAQLKFEKPSVSTVGAERGHSLLIFARYEESALYAMQIS